MKTYSPLQISQSTRVFEQDRRFHWVVSAKLYINLSNGQVQFEHDCIEDALAAMGPVPLLDMGMPKPKTEWLLSGSFYAPGGDLVEGGKASVSLAGKTKTLNVFGDRIWSGGIPSAPMPLRQQPLLYDYAYGGKDYDLNPLGKGYKSEELPNLELASENISSNSKKYQPACFGPLFPDWAQRARYQGTYDKRYMEQYFPGYPVDMDWRLFLCAPQDQWFDGFLQGTEEYRLEGLHPEHPAISGALPGLMPRCFIRNGDDETNINFQEVNLQLDTVWFFPDADVVQLTWRGGMEVADDEASSISHMLLAYESLTDERRSTDHYLAAINRRIASENPLQDSLNTQDLIPNGNPSAMQLLVNSALENAKTNAFGENMKAKSAAIQQQVDSVVGQQMKDVTDKIKDAPVDEVLKQELLDKVSQKDIAAESNPIAEAIEKLLPGSSSSNPNDIDFSDFSFDKMQRTMDEVSGLVEAQKAEALEKAKPQIDAAAEQLKKQLEEADLPGDQKDTIQKQLVQLSNIGSETELPMAELPRLDIDAITQQLQAADNELAKARQTLHQQLTMPGLLNNEMLQQAKDKLSALEQSFNEKFVDELKKAQQQFIAGYGMAAHFSPDGLPPHSDIETQQQQLNACLLQNQPLDHQDWACLDLSGKKLDGLDFSGCLMEQVDLSGASCIGTNFSGAVLARANLSGANLDGAIFDDANIGASDCTNASFKQSSLRNTKLSKSILNNTSFVQAVIDQPEVLEVDIQQCDFTAATITNWPFLERNIEHACFNQAIMENCSFINSRLSSCSFEEAQLPSTAWVNCNIHYVNFQKADMSRNCFVYSDEAPYEFKAADFSGSKLASANLQKITCEDANFTGSLLEYTNFSEANLTKAVFDECQSTSVQFQKADLTRASFKKANLMEAMMGKSILVDTDFQGANLYATDFLRATVSGSNFRGANLDVTLLQDWRPS